ncbi:IS701 family transposase [Streptomyces sp. CA-106110]|uniref:IS701 family transposase n=1 Tax=Streptomyces sp. CA-106110 TaxID=3240044 RepID=UPI003D8B334D
MKAELLDIMPEITDRERAEEFSDQLENLLVEVGGIFPRADLRMRAARCIRGLLSPVSRKNGWQLAEYGGDAEPWGQQHLLDRSVWDVDALRDFTRRYVIDGLDDGGRGAGPGGAGVLVVDETGFAKKGRASVGVARQYSGTLGGVFPCQIGVMAAWATGRGQALIDREIYQPREWTEDRARCRAAHVPDTVGFATKPRLAEQMIARTLPNLPEDRVWVAADEVYGRDGAFRVFLEEHHLPYAVNVQANHTVLPRPGWRHAARLVERHAAEDDWVTLPAGPPSSTPASGSGGYALSPTLRRRPATGRGRGGSSPGDGRRPPPGATTTWPGARPRPPWKSWSVYPGPAGEWRKRSSSRSRPPGWPITRCVPSTAGTGTSPWPSWPRPSWLSRPRPPPATRSPPPAPTASRRSCTPAWTRLPATQGDLADPTSPTGTAAIAFTAYEIARLLWVMAPQPTPAERIRHGLHWSWWRRCHQAVARACHRRRNRAREAEHPTARPPPTGPQTTAGPLISN